MTPVKEVLLTARNKFHDLQSATLVHLAAKAVGEDDLQRVRPLSLHPLPPHEQPSVLSHNGCLLLSCLVHTLL